MADDGMLMNFTIGDSVIKPGDPKAFETFFRRQDFQALRQIFSTMRTCPTLFTLLLDRRSNKNLYNSPTFSPGIALFQNG
jgi:hypothetical protein